MKKSKPTSGMQLVDGDNTTAVSMAVPTAKRRIEIAEIAKRMPAVDDKTKKILEQALKAQGGGETNEQAMAKLVENGTLSIDDILAANSEDPATAKKKTDCIIEMFRVCAVVPDDWEDRLASDDFMYDQDITEVEKHVATFRTKVGA